MKQCLICARLCIVHFVTNASNHARAISDDTLVVTLASAMILFIAFPIVMKNLGGSVNARQLQLIPA